MSRIGSAISRRASGATDRPRKIADKGPERCRGSAIAGTTGQKATLASPAAACVAGYWPAPVRSLVAIAADLDLANRA